MEDNLGFTQSVKTIFGGQECYILTLPREDNLGFTQSVKTIFGGRECYILTLPREDNLGFTQSEINLKKLYIPVRCSNYVLYFHHVLLFVM